MFDACEFDEGCPLWTQNRPNPASDITPLDFMYILHALSISLYHHNNQLFLFIMPICIECRYPVSSLYTTYSKADDRTLGKGVRLTQCPRCKRFADKYVEHDFVVLFIDLVLIKPQVS